MGPDTFEHDLLTTIAVNRLLCFAQLATAAVAAGGEPVAWSRLPPIPNARGVAAPFAGVSGDALIVAGGANFPDKVPWEGGRKVWLDEVWVLEKPDGTWRRAGTLPRPLAYGVSVTVDRAVICIGGSDADRHYADVFALNAGGTSSPLNSLPIPLANAAGAATTGGTIYLACGSTEPGEKAASARAFALNLKSGQPAWRELPPLPAEPRILPVAAAHGDTFYLFGGAALESKEGKIVRRYLRDAWSYSPAVGWRKLKDMPKPCVAAPSPAPVVIRDRNRAERDRLPQAAHRASAGALVNVAAPCVLIAGGDDGSLAGFSPPEKHPGFRGTLLGYDITANTWTEAGKVPAPRVTLPVVEWQGGFVFPSGEMRPGVRSPEVWTFHPAPVKP